MLVQVVFSAEELVAILATKVLLPRMRDHVPHQMLFPVERLVAMLLLALERSYGQLKLRWLLFCSALSIIDVKQIKNLKIIP